MEISKQQLGDVLELKIRGRVDSYWADHLGAAVDQEIRQGFHKLQLDLSEVAYVSSAGIGTLVRLYKDLKAIEGSFVISNCSPVVLKILQLSRLDDLLLAKSAAAPPASSAPRRESPPKKVDRPEAAYEFYTIEPDASLECKLLGDPTPLHSTAFNKNHCTAFGSTDAVFAIGLGALGEDFEECKNRFGEFVAAGGAVAYLPTDGTNVPDFLVAHGTSSAEIQVCYGITCRAKKKQPFSTLLRFESKGGLPLTLTTLVESCLDFSESRQLGIVIIAETAGLIGAALRRSPTTPSDHPRAFDFPAIRDWLTFTAEPAYPNRVVLIAGVALRERSDGVAQVLRPFPTSSGIAFSGHFHAAAFSYRPVQRGQIDLNTSVKTLFENQSLEGVLHLLTDDRPTSGSGETELFRGACWLAPLSVGEEVRP